MNDHATRKSAKDQRARDKDHTDHAQSVENVAYHVTHYQRRTFLDWSLCCGHAFA